MIIVNLTLQELLEIRVTVQSIYIIQSMHCELANALTNIARVKTNFFSGSELNDSRALVDSLIPTFEQYLTNSIYF